MRIILASHKKSSLILPNGVGPSCPRFPYLLNMAGYELLESVGHGWICLFVRS